VGMVAASCCRRTPNPDVAYLSRTVRPRIDHTLPRG
jgi:hypothetical protein